MKKIQLGGHKRGAPIRGYALVDDADYEWLNQWNWSFSEYERGYRAYRQERCEGKMKSIFMHRQILQAPQGLLVDHINRNPLDNRRENLRICTISQNGMNRRLQKNNTSGTAGVVWDKRRSKYASKIKINCKTKNLGYFNKKQDAIKARRDAEIKYFGEFRYKSYEHA